VDAQHPVPANDPEYSFSLLLSSNAASIQRTAQLITLLTSHWTQHTSHTLTDIATSQAFAPAGGSASAADDKFGEVDSDPVAPLESETAAEAAAPGAEAEGMNFGAESFGNEEVNLDEVGEFVSEHDLGGFEQVKKSPTLADLEAMTAAAKKGHFPDLDAKSEMEQMAAQADQYANEEGAMSTTDLRQMAAELDEFKELGKSPKFMEFLKSNAECQKMWNEMQELEAQEKELETNIDFEDVDLKSNPDYVRNKKTGEMMDLNYPRAEEMPKRLQGLKGDDLRATLLANERLAAKAPGWPWPERMDRMSRMALLLKFGMRLTSNVPQEAICR
jgi:hypothetical protein